MTTTAKSTPTKPVRARRQATPVPVQTDAHKDILELTGAVRDLARALKPLEALAEHVPALVEMASVWNAGKNGGRAAWRAGEVTGAFAKWITAIGGALVFLWLVFHAKWELVMKALAG